MDLHVLCVNYDERLIAIVRPSHGGWKFETVQSERSEFIEGFGFREPKLAMHFAENAVKSLGLV
jgi:hypothetical protein